MKAILKTLIDRRDGLNVLYSGCVNGLFPGCILMIEDKSLVVVRDGAGFKLGHVESNFTARFVQDDEGAQALADFWNSRIEVKAVPGLSVKVVPFGDAVRAAYESCRDLAAELKRRSNHE